MNFLLESEIERMAINLLKMQGYEYVYAPNIAPDGITPERETYEQVLLLNRLQNAVKRINPSIPANAQADALKEIQRIASPELLTNNETFHRLLTEGIPVSKQVDGDDRGDRVWLIDFKNPLNNDFVVANQFTVVENNNNKRPDVILFVNGIPLVVFELKNAADENATIHSAFKQIETYKTIIPSLFTYNGFVVISDGLETKAGSISAGYSRFMAWKTADGKVEASHLTSQLKTLIKGMLNKKTLIDLIHHFIVFEKTKHEDPDTGINTITTVKKLAAYHQYYAVNRAVESTLRASGKVKAIGNSCHYTMKNICTISPEAAESPFNRGLPGVERQPVGDHKGGVVWHTQGSGKSLSMVFYTGKIVLAMDNPTIVVITDRNDLDNQLFETFAASKQLLRQEPVQAENREQLKNLLKVGSGGVVFTTIQKFQPDTGNVYQLLSNRENN
ncbi:MAG: type I restriction endonuclease, partial [Bacteroidales bacterium]|nr:type I restriction endonuclease [Bacteroidales bacterium]